MKGKTLLGLYEGLQDGKTWLTNLEKIIYHDWLIVLVQDTVDEDDEMAKKMKFAYICKNDERFKRDDNVHFSIDFSYLGYKFLDFCAAFKHRTMPGYAYRIVFENGAEARADDYSILADGILTYGEGRKPAYIKYDKEGKEVVKFPDECGKLEKIKGNFIVFENDKKYFLFNNLTNAWAVHSPSSAMKTTGIKFRDFYVEVECLVDGTQKAFLFDAEGRQMNKIE